MKLALYQLDVFTDQLFHGNPAAVVPLEEWLPDELLQQIAAENKLPETVYYVLGEDGYKIRWFTPTVEVDLCGHATLAAAYVLFNHEGYEGNEISFDSKSGMLKVEKGPEGWYTLNFPVDHFQVAVPPPALLEGLSPVIPAEIYRGKSDYMVVLDSEEEVRDLKPDIIIFSTVPTRGIIVTAPGESVDFVSRFFAPQSGVDEDPVTGSAHTTLIPYWSRRLGKPSLTARQLSPRGGELQCRLIDDRVAIGGQARLYMIGRIETA